MIKNLVAREILDSRGNPTIEVELETDKAIARAAVPSGASTGVHEALELRDGDKGRYQGKGVLKAVENVNTTIKNQLMYQDLELLTQADLDKKLLELDGTENKSRLGANAILGVSLAFAKAKAYSQNIPLYRYFGTLAATPSPLGTDRVVLPVPMMNIVNGGMHADSGLNFQEFMILPVGAPTFKEALRYGAEIFHTLKGMLHKMHLVTAVGDEGGFAPALGNNGKALETIVQAIEQAGYKPGQDVYLGLDVAASSFYDTEKKVYTVTMKETPEELSTSDLKNYYGELTKQFPLLTIEDPFAEDDWQGFQEMTKEMGDKYQIVGDDLFVTNPKRIQTGLDQHSANAVLIKLNQIGSVTETVQAVGMAMAHNWTTIVSHRSGETEDTTIADLAVGLGTGQIKTGSLSRSERIAKYNQLLRVEEKESKSFYPGLSAFYNIKR